MTGASFSLETEFCPDVTPESDAVRRAGEIIRAGGLVGFPTETVYGLGADARNSEAVAAIFRAKGRPQDNPLICHIAHPEELDTLARTVPEAARRLAETYWPGPLTIILPCRPEVPKEVTAGLDTVGIRLPSHPVARALIEASGTPIAAPSGNRSGRPSPTTAAHMWEDMAGRIDMILDGGPCTVGVESTVVTLAAPVPRLLRPGGITLEQLRAVLGEVEVDKALRQKIDDSEKVSAPGMKYRHSAPAAPVTAVTGDPDRSAAYILSQIGPDDGVICYEEYLDRFLGAAGWVRSIGREDRIDEQARRVFDALRSFDSTGAKRIFAQCPEETGIGLAVANRLKKAAGFHVVNV